MAQATQYATRQELDNVKEEVHRLSVAIAVLTEKTEARFDAMDARFDAMDARFDRMDAAIDARFVDQTIALTKLITDGHTAIISAVMALGKR